MSSIGLDEVRNDLSALVKRVSNGEQIIITRHGVPVATLGPPPVRAPMDPREAIKGLIAASKGIRLRGLSVKKLITEGRR